MCVAIARWPIGHTIRPASAIANAVPRGENRRLPVSLDVPHLVVEITALADVAVAAVAVRRWASREGLDASTAAELATCASELASNTMRHGGGGRIELAAQLDRVIMRAGDRGRGEVAALRERLHEVRSRPQRPSDEHGLATVVRWMDEVEVTERSGGGVEFVASRLRARRRR